MPDVRKTALLFALSLPEAWEDHPWGETVAKVRTKVFAFFGGPAHSLVTVKLDESHGHALSLEGAVPTGYGLGKSGWVTVPVEAPGLDAELLCDWIEESYRIVAPKRLVSQLDVSIEPGPDTDADTPAARARDAK
jgi:predicted DNA-binding protein (MmcQ/YjbR family)